MGYIKQSQIKGAITEYNDTLADFRHTTRDSWNHSAYRAYLNGQYDLFKALGIEVEKPTYTDY